MSGGEAAQADLCDWQHDVDDGGELRASANLFTMDVAAPVADHDAEDNAA